MEKSVREYKRRANGNIASHFGHYSAYYLSRADSRYNPMNLCIKMPPDTLRGYTASNFV